MTAFVVYIRDKYGKRAVFLCRQYRRLCFVGIVHCLNQNKVGAVFCGGSDIVREKAYRVLKGKVTERLKQLSGRPHIKSDENIFLIRGSGFRAGDAGGNQLFVIAEFKLVNSEGVSRNNIAAGFDICSVNSRNVIGS